MLRDSHPDGPLTMSMQQRARTLPAFRWLEDQMPGKFKTNPDIQMLVSFDNDDEAALFRLFWQQEIECEMTDEDVSDEILKRRRTKHDIAEALAGRYFGMRQMVKYDHET